MRVGVGTRGECAEAEGEGPCVSVAPALSLGRCGVLETVGPGRPLRDSGAQSVGWPKSSAPDSSFVRKPESGLPNAVNLIRTCGTSSSCQEWS